MFYCHFYRTAKVCIFSNGANAEQKIISIFDGFVIIAVFANQSISVAIT